MLSFRTLNPLPRWAFIFTKFIHNASVNDAKKYTPRRAMMYVPGNDEKKVGKIPSLGADSIILDCEDGVALNRKEDARNLIHKVVTEKLVEFGRAECCVRVNAVDSGLCEADLDTIFKGPVYPTSVTLPKVESKSQLEWFASKLNTLLPSGHQVKLIIFIESARALLDMKGICEHGVQLQTQGAPFALEGAVFGSDDFCADIGATRSSEAIEVLYARQHFVTVCKAFRLQAVDLVYINFKDAEGLERQSLEGARMGFTGKQVIHPNQIPIVQQAFTPSNEKIDWARQLIAAFEKHQQSGQGAFSFRGHMIDMPLLLQARNVLQLAQFTE